MAESATFGVVHVGVAFGVGYTLTGGIAIAGAITLVGARRRWRGKAERAVAVPT